MKGRNIFFQNETCWGVDLFPFAIASLVVLEILGLAYIKKKEKTMHINLYKIALVFFFFCGGGAQKIVDHDQPLARSKKP